LITEVFKAPFLFPRRGKDRKEKKKKKMEYNIKYVLLNRTPFGGQGGFLC